AGFFTQVPQGEFAVDITSTPQENVDAFNRASPTSQSNDLCLSFICMAPGVPIYGQSPPASSRLNVAQAVRNFQTPMNHAYNFTIEQELTNKMSLSVAYVGTAGRDL